MIPDVLGKYTEGCLSFSYQASNLLELITNLSKDKPRLFSILFNAQGDLNGFVNLYLNSQPISTYLPESIKLNSNDVIEVITSVSGG